jgi:hypothetical protein
MMDLQRGIMAAIGTFVLVTGLWALLSPRSALASNYRWDRKWTRVFSLGRIDPKPRELTDRAVRLASVLGGIFVVGGLVLLYFGLTSLL